MMTDRDNALFLYGEYAAKGWHLVVLYGVQADLSCRCGNPHCTDIGKHPIPTRGVKEATRDFATIERWVHAHWPCNMGLATGQISGVTAIDIDTGPGKFGAEKWAAIVQAHGEVDTLMARTGSGGIHCLFKYNAALKTSSNTIDTNIDCRNDRGYIVLAPSQHRSGGSYQWINWGTELADLPAWLTVKRERRGRPKKDDIFHGKYSLEQVEQMLAVVPADDRDLWRAIGIILGREYAREDAAWNLYVAWSDTWGGVKARGHDKIMHEAFYDLSQQSADGGLTIGTLVKAALDHGWVPKKGEVPHGHFVYYGPGNNFIYRPTGSAWVAAAVDIMCSPVNVNGKLIKASVYIHDTAKCTSMTSDPSRDEDVVKGVDSRDGDMIPTEGAAVYNTYRHPTIEPGDARMATPFVAHCRKLFSKDGDCDQFLNYMAHRVQRPWEKPRFALLIAGDQGIGKDTAIEFCCPALGVWNVANIDPGAFESAYNDFIVCALIRINEAANLHDMSKWAFNERTKVVIAGSPDIARVNPKYGEQFVVKMYCGVIITTNNLLSGIYIPPDDRRYDVIECATMAEMGLLNELVRREYFSELWDWFLNGGSAHVAAFLRERDLRGFSCNNGQRKTAAHKEVVQHGALSDEWLDDILDGLGYPGMVRGDWVVAAATAQGEKAADVKRKMAASMGRANYVRYNNPKTKDGRWKIGDAKVMVYIKTGATPTDELFEKLSEKPF